jgi:hypothetical protein
VSHTASRAAARQELIVRGNRPRLLKKRTPAWRHGEVEQKNHARVFWENQLFKGYPGRAGERTPGSFDLIYFLNSITLPLSHSSSPFLENNRNVVV